MFGVLFSIGEIEDIVDAITTYAETDVYVDAANVVIPDVKQKTDEGTSYMGRSFQPYAPSYAKRRRKNNLQTSHVDLRVTGHLLDNLHLEGDMIVPADEDVKKAEGLNFGNAHNKMEARPFLGADEATVQKVEETVAQKLEERL
jgi:hypothetical protein